MRVVLATGRALRVLAIGLPLILGTVSVARAESPADSCPPPDPTPEIAPSDYRLRDSTPQMRWNFADNKRNHMDVELTRMRSGEYSERVMGGLDFTLRHWPNHLLALQALIDYDLAGGKRYYYLPAECYFLHALIFAPDDISVLAAYGYWLSKKGETQRAIVIYQQALALEPAAAGIHYNLGLIYFSLGDYAKSLEQAQMAYAGGYPLPGLKRKLEQAGHWPTKPAGQ